MTAYINYFVYIFQKMTAYIKNFVNLNKIIAGKHLIMAYNIPTMQI